jgi:hypothetical protein
MEKMDQTRTDCNLTRMGFPGETPLFCSHYFPFLLVFFIDYVAALTPDNLLLSKRVSERMVSLHKLEMFVHNHLMAGPSTSHALHVMLFRTHSLRIVLTFTG